MRVFWAEESFHREYFTKIHTFNDFYEKCKLLKNMIFSYINESPNWISFWKQNLKPQLRGFQFEIVENTHMALALKNDKLSKEEKERCIQELLKKRFKNIEQENIIIQNKIKQLESENLQKQVENNREIDIKLIEKEVVNKKNEVKKLEKKMQDFDFEKDIEDAPQLKTLLKKSSEKAFYLKNHLEELNENIKPLIQEE